MSAGFISEAANRPARPLDDEADFVIVGSGASGATAARVLSEAGLDVIVLEEGPWVRTESFPFDAYSAFSKCWRDMGFQVAEGRALVPVIQGRCVGGTTTINGAIIHRLPEPIFASWCETHGVGDALRYADIDATFDRLDEELGVAPAPEERLGRNNTLMRAGVEALGWRGNAIRRNVRDCRGSGRCTQGCPHGAKQSMNLSYVPRAVRAGARVYAECRATRVVAEGGRAAAVEARLRVGAEGPAKTEVLARFRARRGVLVGASAIQTPLLLAASGIGRRSGLVGRRFQAHPGTSVMAVFDDPVAMWYGATQAYESTHFWDERMKFEAVGVPLSIGAARLPGFGAELVRNIADWGHVAQWGLQVRATAHGRVKRGWTGRTVIRYSPDTADAARFKLGVKRLVEMAFAAGAREVLPGVHGLPERMTSPDEARAIDALPDEPRLFHYIAAHLFGTAVMGRDPASSVVAPTGESHELPGLYVIDSSVFPTNLGVNPQHSISALAWLVAARLT